MDKEINELQKRINTFRKPHQQEKKISNTIDGFTIATELVAGVIVGLIIGLFFDRMLNSKPIFLIICLFIGIIASFKVVWQKLNRKNNDTYT